MPDVARRMSRAEEKTHEKPGTPTVDLTTKEASDGERRSSEKTFMNNQSERRRTPSNRLEDSSTGEAAGD